MQDGKNSNGFSGIIGIAGIGKTTLASALFNSIRWDFERASSIEDIEGEAEKNGLLDVQRKLLCNLMHHDYQVPDLSHSQAKQIIKKRFSNIDALIFLDNIKDYNQLDAILSPEVLLPGSTLIVTSRDSSIFKLHNNFLKYEMPGLNGSQSKELFCLHAFESGVACAPFKNLVDKFVHVCNGIPLALKICGRELYSESSPVIWESYLEKLTETMPVHLKNILQVSYARLDEKQKQILLDIAIFFHGENVRTIERIWEEKSFAYDLRTLEFKCMIKKSEMDVLTMHGAFRYLGRAIVDEESPNPGSRSRLWRPKDIKKVLEKFEGTEKVRGLSLVFGGSVIWNQDRFGRPCAWPADAFANMKELKLLQLRDDCVEGDLQKLPQGLVWLRWQNYPCECMPPNLNDARVLDFCGGKLVSLWDDQSQVPLKLLELNLRRCYKLQRVQDSIGRFRALQKLDFSECSLLKTLSEEFCYLESLEVLNLNRCLNLEYLPSGFGGLRRLRDVSLRECQKLKALPESFGLLKEIEYLDMTHCTNVKIEEGSFGSISTLKEVYLLNCRKLETFPTQLTRQRSLEKLGVATGGFRYRGRIATGGFRNMYSGGIAGFGHNEIFIDIPENIGDLSKLTELRLGNLTGIPESIGNLSQLVSFRLWGLANMRAIPDSIGLNNLRLLECPQLQELPTSIGNLSCLSRLRLLGLHLTDRFLTEENSVLLENLISPSLEFTFTESAIPYPTAWLDVYHFQMMSKRDTIPFVSGSSGLTCSLPTATTKERAAIIICFVSVLQLIDELNDNQLVRCRFQWCSETGENNLPFERFPCFSLGDSIHLKILSAKRHKDLGEKGGFNVLMDKLSSSVKGYFKYGWIKIIEEGEEKLIQQICGDFFRELTRQRPLAAARASTPSLLDLGNVHALDIANCTIRRTLFLYKTPIQEEKMELVLRKKQLFWRGDKELEHLDLSIMNTTSIPLFLTLKSMVNLYNMEVIISNNKSVEAYKDELQEYQDNSVIKSHANIPVQVAKILKSRTESISEAKNGQSTALQQELTI